MAQISQPKKGGKNMTTSAVRKAHYAEYKAHLTREKHKIRRILRSSGKEAAKAYAQTRMLIGHLSGLLAHYRVKKQAE
jgi:hypothetical protein